MMDNIKEACRVLQAGGLILYPTDTIWGIGCDATNEAAVQRVFQLKQRADHRAMLALIDSAARLELYVEEVPPVAWDLIEVADRPLTIIFDKAKNLAPNLTAEDGSIGIRVTREEFSNGLCRRFGKPVVSTSANVSGEIFPLTFSDIAPCIKQGVDYVVNYRRDDVRQRQPSAIIRLGKGGLVQVIR